MRIFIVEFVSDIDTWTESVLAESADSAVENALAPFTGGVTAHIVLDSDDCESLEDFEESLAFWGC